MDEDQVDVPWTVAGPALASLGTIPTTVIPAAAEHPLLGPVLVGGAGVAAVFTANQITERHPTVRTWRKRWRDRLVRFTGVGAALHTSWSAAVAYLLPMHEPAFFHTGLTSLALLGVSEGLTCWWFNAARAHPTAREEQQDQQEDIAAGQAGPQRVQDDQADAIASPEQTHRALSDGEEKFMRDFTRQLFRLGGVPGPEYTGFQNLGSTGFNIEVRIPPPGRMPKKAANIGYLSTGQHGEGLANALGTLVGKDIQSDWVQIHKKPAAGAYTITCLQRDALADVHEFVDDFDAETGVPTPRSHEEPVHLGYRADGQEFWANLAQHGREVGKTQSGKSCTIHLKIQNVTATYDGVQWVGGSLKLYDLVADWVEPFHNTSERIPINWVASGARDTTRMLLAAVNIMNARNAQPKSARKHWKALYVQIDEESDLHEQPNARVKYGKGVVSASFLIAKLRKGGQGTKVYINTASQRGTQDHSGTHGADVVTNVGYGFAFMTKDPGDIPRVLNNNDAYHVKNPPHPGCFWNDGEHALELIKAKYIQDSDPQKKKLHNGETIRDIAWRRRHCDNELDEYSAKAAGHDYASRWRFATDDFFDYLLRTASGGGSMYDSPEEAAELLATESTDDGDKGGEDGDDEVVVPNVDPNDEEDLSDEAIGAREFQAELQAYLSRASGQTPRQTPGEQDESSAAEASEAGEQTPQQTSEQTPGEQQRSTNSGVPVTRADRVLAIVTDVGSDPVTRRHIVDELSYRYDDAPENTQVIDAALRKLVGTGQLVRAGDGRYALPDVATDREHAVVE